MSKQHGIAWLNIPGFKGETLNISSGCSKVSPGCQNCYAERLFPRVYGSEVVVTLHRTGTTCGSRERKRRFTDIKIHQDRLRKIDGWRDRRVVFINSMSDLFHEQVPWELQYKFFERAFLNPKHIYIVLTKRAERMHKHMPQIYTHLARNYHSVKRAHDVLENVWLGVSAEDQERFTERVPYLLETPADKRIVSIEPMIEEIDVTVNVQAVHPLNEGYGFRALEGLGWVIVGGESGSKARPFDPDWARDIRDLCAADHVPFFMKQMSAHGGADKNDIPEDLIVREFPI